MGIFHTDTDSDGRAEPNRQNKLVPYFTLDLMLRSYLLSAKISSVFLGFCKPKWKYYSFAMPACLSVCSFVQPQLCSETISGINLYFCMATRRNYVDKMDFTVNGFFLVLPYRVEFRYIRVITIGGT